MVPSGLEADWTNVLYRPFVRLDPLVRLRRVTYHVRRREHRLMERDELLVAVDGHPTQRKVHSPVPNRPPPAVLTSPLVPDCGGEGGVL